MLPWVKVQTVGINMYQINYLLKALKEKEQVLEVCSFIDFIFYAVFFLCFTATIRFKKKNYVFLNCLMKMAITFFKDGSSSILIKTLIFYQFKILANKFILTLFYDFIIKLL